MAFGVKREELKQWKRDVKNGDIAFLTHFWLDDRFPDAKTVTKVGCSDRDKLISWGEQYGLKPEWMHKDPEYPHFDLLGERQRSILKAEGKTDHLKRFDLA